MTSNNDILNLKKLNKNKRKADFVSVVSFHNGGGDDDDGGTGFF